jgi:predicted DNA-binding protein
MLRTSLYLPTPLHQRLIVASKQEGKPMSRLVGELLDKALASRESAKLQRMYSGLLKKGGFGPANITDASTTIDEVLYGANGAWKGQRD